MGARAAPIMHSFSFGTPHKPMYLDKGITARAVCEVKGSRFIVTLHNFVHSRGNLTFL